jgi:hypothetical protein
MREEAQRRQVINYQLYQMPLPARPAASTPNIGVYKWRAPTLDFTAKANALEGEQANVQSGAHNLRLISPTPNYYPGDEEEDSGLAYSPLSKLPPLAEWVDRYTVTVLEIWSGRRPAAQLSRWSHRVVYLELARRAGLLSKAPKIKRLHINSPIPAIAEVVAILNFDNRVRSLALRFEGVNEKWLCTHCQLI